MKAEEMSPSTARLLALLRQAEPEDVAVLREYNLPPGSEAPLEELVMAILRHGSHDVKRHFQGAPKTYLELVRDVAEAVKVPWEEDEDEALLERRIYLQIFRRAVTRLSPAEREPLRQLLAQTGAEAEEVERLFLEGTMRHFLPSLGYLVAWNVARLVAFALAREAGAGLLSEGLAAALLGPLGLALGALIVGWDLAGPAYRKTVPTVVHIAYLREKAWQRQQSRPAEEEQG